MTTWVAAVSFPKVFTFEKFSFLLIFLVNNYMDMCSSRKYIFGKVSRECLTEITVSSSSLNHVGGDRGEGCLGSTVGSVLLGGRGVVVKL